jgi:hypothetical protein
MKFQSSINLGDDHIGASILIEDHDVDAVYFHIETNSPVGIGFSVGGHVDLDAAEKLVAMLKEGIDAVKENRARVASGRAVR